MTEERDSLIASQQLDIIRLIKQCREYESVLESITTKIVCIGGPLNDNCGMYDFKQRKIFHAIVDDVASVINTKGTRG